MAARRQRRFRKRHEGALGIRQGAGNHRAVGQNLDLGTRPRPPGNQRLAGRLDADHIKCRGAAGLGRRLRRAGWRDRCQIAGLGRGFGLIRPGSRSESRHIRPACHRRFVPLRSGRLCAGRYGSGVRLVLRLIRGCSRRPGRAALREVCRQRNRLWYRTGKEQSRARKDQRKHEGKNGERTAHGPVPASFPSGIAEALESSLYSGSRRRSRDCLVSKLDHPAPPIR